MISRLLDSVILIDHLNGVDKATRFVLGLDPQETAISVITRAEIWVGIAQPDLERVKALLDQFRNLAIDTPIADLGASLRKEHGWKLPDAFQAAVATYHHVKLVTRNTKDFDPRRHDFIEVPYVI
ncbi:MAG: PIN domain-containing protein [Deltaproteobacteria bacterium]|jgi:predicted nucleic acid-binding protein